MCVNKLKIYFVVLAGIVLFAAARASSDEQFAYDDKGRRNPFIPLVTPDGRLLKLDTEVREGIKGLVLEGIIYDKAGLSYAMVNGSVIKIGDTVSDYQVLKIEKDKVVFIKQGEMFAIELKKEE